MPTETVRIGCPTEIDGAAHYIADQRGFYKDAGLDVELVPYDPSKSVLTRAMAADGAWDIAIADAMEVIIGEKFGLRTVGLSSDKSTGNQIVANPKGVELWPPRAMSREYPIVLSMNTTVEYAARACMRSHGFKMEDVRFIDRSAETCVEYLSGDNPKALFGAFQFPYMYNLLENELGSEVICSAASADEKIVGGIVVDSTLAEEKPQVVTRVLAAWLRAIEFMKDTDNKDEVLKYLRTFFVDRDVHISHEFLERHLMGTKLFGIDQQLELMKRRDGSPPRSYFDQWTAGLGGYMVERGMRADLPDPSLYITDQFLQMVKTDPKLYDFARGMGRPEYGVIVPEAVVFESNHSGTTPIGLLLSFTIAFAFAFSVMRQLRPFSRLRKAISREASHEYNRVDTSPGYIELADSHEIN